MAIGAPGKWTTPEVGDSRYGFDQTPASVEWLSVAFSIMSMACTKSAATSHLLWCVCLAFCLRPFVSQDLALQSPNSSCCCFFLLMGLCLSLRIQSIQMGGIYGFYSRKRNTDFGNFLCIWVLGPLGFVDSFTAQASPIPMTLQNALGSQGPLGASKLMTAIWVFHSPPQDQMLRGDVMIM